MIPTNQSTMTQDNDPGSPAAAVPDASISHTGALAYWSSTPATVDGMLGGFEPINKVDLQGSKNFLAKLRRERALRQSSTASPSSQRQQGLELLGRAVDCGAGIGRITAGLLCTVASVVDVVEPVEKFTAEITQGESFAALRTAGKIGNVHNVGLQAWTPDTGAYDLIWNQWCLGQLTDVQLVEYLRRCGRGVKDEGWVIVKENLSTHALGEDIFDDDTDSSVTRSDVKFKEIFERAGFKIVAEEVQKGFPKALFPVKVYALQPISDG